tara:strand:- start:11610 stop:11996 length:387 start_codon:yes stop_codon:yes gene_type:complete
MFVAKIFPFFIFLQYTFNHSLFLIKIQRLLYIFKKKVNLQPQIFKMRTDIHPDNYRLVAFKDMSNDDIFITKSTVNSKETIDFEGVEYPLVKLEISRTSHPYYTGKSKLVDSAGRIDKFKNKYSKYKK